MSLVILFRGRQEKLPDYQETRKWSNAASKTPFPMVAVTKQNATPFIEFFSVRTLWATKKKWRTPCWIWWSLFTRGLQEHDAPSSTPKCRVTLSMLSKKKPLDDKLPLVVTDAGGRYSVKEPRVRNVSLVLKRKPQCVRSLSESSQLWSL